MRLLRLIDLFRSHCAGWAGQSGGTLFFFPRDFEAILHCSLFLKNAISSAVGLIVRVHPPLPRATFHINQTDVTAKRNSVAWNFSKLAPQNGIRGRMGGHPSVKGVKKGRRMKDLVEVAALCIRSGSNWNKNPRQVAHSGLFTGLLVWADSLKSKE